MGHCLEVKKERKGVRCSAFYWPGKRMLKLEVSFVEEQMSKRLKR
jgi:hypothetical protein